MAIISWLIIPALFSSLIYIVIQLMILKWWFRIAAYPEPLVDLDSQPPFVSVIIAARNEEDNIEACLTSLNQQDLPSHQFEVILINDHSEDGTVEKANAARIPNLKIFPLQSGLQGKKDAIRFGISKSNGSYLLFTDADCVLPDSWVRSMRNHMLIGNLDAVCAAISMKRGQKSILNRFQQLDNMGMMAVSAAAINGDYFSIANGANLGIRRSILSDKVIDWNDKFASGDDMALISHVQKRGGRICFVPDPKTIVATKTETTWKALFIQRLRWGTKNKSSHQMGLIFVVVIVYVASLSNAIALMLFPLFLYGQLGSVPHWFWSFIFLKPLVDLILLSRLRAFFNVKVATIKIPFFSMLHSFYIFLVGSLSLIQVKYPWKGRRVQ